MPRDITFNPNYDVLDRDLVHALRHFCFNNFTEFYIRYKFELRMSKATFFRIMNGEMTSVEKIRSLKIIMKKMGVVKDVKTQGCEWLVQKNLVVELIRYVDAILEMPTLTNLANLKDFINKYKLMMIA